MRIMWMAAGALAAASLTALPAEAQIFGGNRDGRARRQSRNVYGQTDAAYRYGYERGFGDGIDHGAKDVDKRHDFNFAHSKDYRNGDKGYKSSYGPKYDYIAGYRAGYEEGYATGYDQPGHGRGRGAIYRRNGGSDSRDGYYDDQGRFHAYGTARSRRNDRGYDPYGDQRDNGYYDENGRYHPGDGRWNDEDQRP
ncbi:MAG TPA: hypothetical protein VGL15_12125 [Vicinamibacteria bacterium]|jgi:hypothetical protein